MVHGVVVVRMFDVDAWDSSRNAPRRTTAWRMAPRGVCTLTRTDLMIERKRDFTRFIEEPIVGFLRYD